MTPPPDKTNLPATGKRRGAPRGNANAARHGLYRRLLPTDLRDLALIARGIGDLNPEIELTRARLARAVRANELGAEASSAIDRITDLIGRLMERQARIDEARARIAAMEREAGERDGQHEPIEIVVRDYDCPNCSAKEQDSAP